MKLRKKIKITILVLAALLAGLAITMSMTNPSSNDHLNVIAEYLNNYDLSQIELTEEEQAQYTAYMSSGANANIMDKVVKPSFQVEDYGLWSVGKINGNKVTLGMFNNVMLVDGDAIPRGLIDRSMLQHNE